MGKTGELEQVSQEEFLRSLREGRCREIKAGNTIIGPHRDDLMLMIDDFKVNGYASTGQERSITISLKMSQVEYLGKKEGEKPVVLLDDCFLELDQDRKKRIWQELDGRAQVVLAMTEMDKNILNTNNITTVQLSEPMREKTCTN